MAREMAGAGSGTARPAHTYTVMRSVVVDAPRSRVYDEVSDFHRWRAWSPWEDLDPGLQRRYSGAGRGTGAVYSWRGNRKAGVGTMRITRADAPSLVHIDLEFEKPFKARNDVAITFEPTGPAGEETVVTWTMSGHQPLLLRVVDRFWSMEKLVGPDLDKGLARLKALAERSSG